MKTERHCSALFNIVVVDTYQQW